MSFNRIAVLSDVHANFYALDAVLTHASKQQIDETWCMGDVVGYGPEPLRCLKYLLESVNHQIWVIGNNDEALGYFPASNDYHPEDTLENVFNPLQIRIGTNPDTHSSMKMNYELLKLYPELLEFLLSRKHKIKMGNVFLVHGGIRAKKPTMTYTHNAWDARDEYLSIKTCYKKFIPKIFIVGHTHIPCCFHGENTTNKLNFKDIDIENGAVIDLQEYYWLLNPGSVGQPRDGDNRASYLIIDFNKNYVQFHRVVYNIQATQKIMEDIKMPVNLIKRLQVAH